VLEIHPHDAELRGVKEGDWVKLASRSGETALRATLTDRVSPGVVYTTFHHPGTQANVITTDYSDWATNCPEYKVTAVQVSLSNGPTEWQKDYAERLIGDHGLDLRGVFRRRALVPFVLVPRSIAAKHGSAEKLSMLKNLQQAHDAFVFGASYAALALMRSIMEAVLRDHYRADGKDMNERIQNARRQLPPGANDAALHRLRKRANAILHLDQEKDEGLPELDEVRLEKEIVSLLFVLRALIEGAK
jgi:formylmethanofuran dehydrogenase subunit D